MYVGVTEEYYVLLVVLMLNQLIVAVFASFLLSFCLPGLYHGFKFRVWRISTAITALYEQRCSLECGMPFLIVFHDNRVYFIQLLSDLFQKHIIFTPSVHLLVIAICFLRCVLLIVQCLDRSNLLCKYVMSFEKNNESFKARPSHLKQSNFY